MLLIVFYESRQSAVHENITNVTKEQFFWTFEELEILNNTLQTPSTEISLAELKIILKDLCAVTVYTCLKIYMYKKHCLFLPTILHSLACFIMGLLNMLQIHGFVYT